MIIGVTGTDGSGKGTLTEYLVREYKFAHFSAREFIVAEIERRGLVADRANMRLVANALRAERGNDVLVAEAFLWREQNGVECVVIESIRAVAEAETLKARGGTLLAVDADPELRYERIRMRRSASDQVTYEEFLAHEELEKNDPDPHGMQKAKVMAMADYTITNTASVPELEKAVGELMNSLGVERK